MDTEVVRIYETLRNHYPIELTSALSLGFNVDYPILSGVSVLGRFEMFYDDVPSFTFYAMHSNREVFAHWHLQTASEAEKAVADFMEGKITIVQFGQSNNT